MKENDTDAEGASTMTAFAYDYDKQEWKTGTEGAALRKRQAAADLELLRGPNGPNYARFIGMKPETFKRLTGKELR